jgi:hypothetical protein
VSSLEQKIDKLTSPLALDLSPCQGFINNQWEDKRLKHWRTGGGIGRETELPIDEAASADDDNKAIVGNNNICHKKLTINQ